MSTSCCPSKPLSPRCEGGLFVCVGRSWPGQNQSAFSAGADSYSRKIRRMENPADAKTQSEAAATGRASFEAQATECLRVGTAERGLLLALAVHLMQDAEEGEDLYQQTLLDCHDTIQRKGFNGANYKFYLYQSIKWGHVARQRAAGKRRPLEEAEQYNLTHAHAPAPEWDALAELAAQVQQELEARYPARWVAAFQLHAAGKTCRELEELMTPRRHFTCIASKLRRMKDALRETFGAAWANLDPAE